MNESLLQKVNSHLLKGFNRRIFPNVVHGSLLLWFWGEKLYFIVDRLRFFGPVFRKTDSFWSRFGSSELIILLYHSHCLIFFLHFCYFASVPIFLFAASQINTHIHNFWWHIRISMPTKSCVCVPSAIISSISVSVCFKWTEISFDREKWEQVNICCCRSNGNASKIIFFSPLSLLLIHFVSAQFTSYVIFDERQHKIMPLNMVGSRIRTYEHEHIKTSSIYKQISWYFAWP